MRRFIDPMLALAEQPSTFTDRSFERELVGLLRQSRWGAASDDEVLATASRIRDHDPDSWVSEWVWTAGEAWAGANRAAARGRRIMRADACCVAANYYGAGALPGRSRGGAGSVCRALASPPKLLGPCRR